MALEKLRESRVRRGKRNAVGMAGGWSRSLSGGLLPFGVDQGPWGAACPPPCEILLWVPASHAALVVPGLLFPGDQLFFPGPLATSVGAGDMFGTLG